ncbi:uncharacterized protein SCHCODRAFT_02523650 [Schizophyllum commune H4-8]|uniref:uncharacterized protein n=1 Tax=Schizophyllum commune (strain H4-8 / FGSC 9210) TaxID=578458 RepID=UPI0021608CA2|nr:uncharacterized protein SCHCODRAFT_02523650 [Schizophyllum commune H4-8]KAI5899313.1 hypothetical protein SCHCODRAFT_02523650 [Schizophyllum commune H4-8]
MLAAFPRPFFTPRAFSTARRWASTGGRPLIGRYTDVVPTELARVQSGRNIRLRDYEQQRANGRLSYDLKLKDGKVLPAEGPNFIGPNGCSLRPPLSPMFQEVVRNFRGRNVTIYVLKEGTPLPPTLQILHEHSDHYSMQCTKPMTLEELDAELTKFFETHARVLDKFEFDDEYPFSIE